MMTREYPPEVYGGAGVHVTELTKALRAYAEVDVHCIGAKRPGAIAHNPDPALLGANAALTMLSADLSMAAGSSGADIIHSHTWYTGLAGHLSSVLHGRPHVLTAHSLEPLRPWKAEQLGGGYQISRWVEETAIHTAAGVIAVSDGMRRDVLATYPGLDPDKVLVIRNGINTEYYTPAEGGPDAPLPEVLRRIGVRPDLPIVVFVGRVTKQKGLRHLIAAAHKFHPESQLVLCAGAPDTPEIAAEIGNMVAALSATRTGVFWLRSMIPEADKREILRAATVFVCPSIYEPLGIVNLEAMACGTAVVASDVGGIPEVVDHEVTGLLAHYDEADTESYEAELATAVNILLEAPEKARAYGEAGRSRVVGEFSWDHVAQQTIEAYREILARYTP